MTGRASCSLIERNIVMCRPCPPLFRLGDVVEEMNNRIVAGFVSATVETFHRNVTDSTQWPSESCQFARAVKA